MKYLCEFVGGVYGGHRIPLEFAEAITNDRSSDLSAEREAGCLVRRTELDNKPVFKDYLGPMWDGVRYVHEDGRLLYEFEASAEQKEALECVAVLRYETQAVYDRYND